LSVSRSESSFDDAHFTPEKSSSKANKDNLRTMPISKSMVGGLRIQGKATI
jgi:hypothetical protein